MALPYVSLPASVLNCTRSAPVLVGRVAKVEVFRPGVDRRPLRIGRQTGVVDPEDAMGAPDIKVTLGADQPAV